MQFALALLRIGAMEPGSFVLIQEEKLLTPTFVRAFTQSGMSFSNRLMVAGMHSFKTLEISDGLFPKCLEFYRNVRDQRNSKVK